MTQIIRSTSKWTKMLSKWMLSWWEDSRHMVWHLFVAEVCSPGTDVASLGLQGLQPSFELIDNRRVCLLNTSVDQALQLLGILTHIIVHHLLIQLYNTNTLHSILLLLKPVSFLKHSFLHFPLEADSVLTIWCHDASCITLGTYSSVVPTMSQLNTPLYTHAPVKPAEEGQHVEQRVITYTALQVWPFSHSLHLQVWLFPILGGKHTPETTC